MSIIATAIATFSFAGGAPNDFVNKLFDASKTPVFLCLGEPVKLPELTFEVADLDSIAKAFRKSQTVTRLPGVEMLFSDRLVATSLLARGPLLEDRYNPVNAKCPDQVFRDGKVNFQLGSNELLYLKSLEGGNFSKPVVVHRSLGSMAFGIRVKGMEEKEFFARIAKVAGGRILPDDKKYEIVPIASELAKRCERTIRMSMSSSIAQSDMQIKAQEARIALIKELSEKEIIQATSDGNRSLVSMPIRSKPKTYKALLSWLDARANQQIPPNSISKAPEPIDLAKVVWEKSTFSVDRNLNIHVQLIVWDSAANAERSLPMRITGDVMRGG